MKNTKSGNEVDDVEPITEMEHLKELLQVQLFECEMLQSMFPKEFVLDFGIVLDIQDFISGKTVNKPPQLNFIIYLEVTPLKLEINVNFPLNYPELKPQVFVSSSQFNRIQQRNLNEAVRDFVKNTQKDEIVIGSLIEWLQENTLVICDGSHESAQSQADAAVSTKDQIFSRFWILSHHIYAKAKRKKILDLARKCNISGFCLPGKPGIICVEGYRSDCEEWWAEIKSMTWQKIGCIKIEEFLINSNGDIPKKFSDFHEITFNENRMKKQDHHMDFGEFHRYLKEKECEYMFKAFFGFDGK